MKKIATLSIAVMACMAFLFGSVTYSQDWNKEQTELWNLVDQSWANFAAKDFDATLKMFHEKYSGWNNESPLPDNFNRVKKFYAMMHEYLEEFKYDLQPARIVIVDDAAVVHYYFSFTMTFTEGKKQHYEGRNTEFYVKQGNKWKLLGDLSVAEEDDD